MRRKEKGFTLIEMIVAFAVLGVAVLGIGGLFVTSARSYAEVNAETELQYEAQLALNQMEDMLIDSTLGVNYNYVTNEDDTSSYQFVKHDGEASGTAAAKVLYVFNVDMTDASKYLSLMLKWVAADECIYYKEVNAAQSAEGTVSENIPIKGNTQADGWELLAEGVTKFAVDLSAYEETKKVGVELALKQGTHTYETKGTITMRNNVLINENSISKIYENVERIIASTITGVEVTANPQVSVPGGRVQLRAKVLGTGYPSQDIYKWVVASDQMMTQIVYDSLSADGSHGDGDTWIDTETQVLYIGETVGEDVEQGGSTFHETLYIRAYAKTGQVNADGDPSYVCNEAPTSVNIKEITNIQVEPTADLTLPVNADLTEATSSWAVASLGQEPPEMKVNPANVIKMNATVIGSDSLDASDKEIVWSIVGSTENVVATISATGQLEIGKYSQGGTFYVRASLNLDRTKYVDYRVVVGNTFADGASLEMTADSYVVDRGAVSQCTLKLNNKDVDENDYNWSVIVTDTLGQTITGNPITVDSTGLVTVKETLSFDYKYTFTVTASLKTNPAISAAKTFTVPKVVVSLNPQITYAQMGTTVSGIVCTVKGLAEYDIDWSMAKETNPGYYFTTSGQTRITGSKTSDYGSTAEVKIGADEPENLTYMRVKATLKGYSNYFATMKINTKDIDFQINRGNTRILRGGDAVDFSVSCTAEGFDKNQVTWSIAETATLNGSEISLDKDHITINEDGKLTVDSKFDLEHYKENITVTVRGEWEGLSATQEITVLASKVTITPDNVSWNSYESEKSFSLSFTNWKIEAEQIQWSLCDSSKGALSDKVGLKLSATTGTSVKVTLNSRKEIPASGFYVKASITDGTTTVDAYAEVTKRTWSIYAMRKDYRNNWIKTDEIVLTKQSGGDPGGGDQKYGMVTLMSSPGESELGKITWTYNGKKIQSEGNNYTRLIVTGKQWKTGDTITVTATLNTGESQAMTLKVVVENNPW